MIISALDIRILSYLRSKINPGSIYDIVKGTRYKTPSGPKEIAYQTIKQHCEKLFHNHLIHMWTNKNPKKRPRVRYAYDPTKTPSILKLIEQRRQLNKSQNPNS